MSRRSTRITAAASSENIGMPSAQSHILPNIAAATAGSNQYFQNYYSHPANTRLLIGNLSQTGGKRHGSVGRALPKPPKAPEKPLMPYMRYSRKVWDDVRANQNKNQDLKLWEVGKIIGQMWRELPATERQQYMDEYEIAKVEHVELLKAYQLSPEYQTYLQAKSRAEAIMAATEGLADKDDAYMSIEPIDETVEDSDMCYSVKHVAAARFQRNHRLVNDILGEAVHVPSTCVVVTSQRLNVLKNQVQSLELHQKKLETELVHLEESHIIKKRKWIDQAKEFGKEMKRLRGITPQEYYKEYKQKQQNAAAQQKQLEEARKEKIAKEKAEESKKEEQKEKTGSTTELEKKSSEEITETTDKKETPDKIEESESKTESPSITKEEKDKEEETMEVEESITNESKADNKAETNEDEEPDTEHKSTTEKTDQSEAEEKSEKDSEEKPTEQKSETEDSQN
uniref:SWI/SNF-related matrix-associated actin-dependent regulator of chromatin subfamily E member 1-like n=1 Tax=Styela clava TaxID=7725 RepID=UPI00193A80CB|nr:SWI/SNF-related matrix-associated actin-dependent regulator of chromatin subfamily E member 1-like [Styela clava]